MFKQDAAQGEKARHREKNNKSLEHKMKKLTYLNDDQALYKTLKYFRR